MSDKFYRQKVYYVITLRFDVRFQVFFKFNMGVYHYLTLYRSAPRCFYISFDYLDTLLQAILPLRGKILNIERKDEAAMYKNEEIQNLILALGLGVKVASFYC